MMKEQFVPVKGVMACEERGFTKGILTKDSGKAIDPLVRSRYINAVNRGELVYMVKEDVEVKKEEKVEEVKKKIGRPKNK